MSYVRFLKEAEGGRWKAGDIYHVGKDIAEELAENFVERGAAVWEELVETTSAEPIDAENADARPRRRRRDS